MQSVNPATGDVVDTYDGDDAGAVEDALDRADAAFEDWRDRSIADREALLDAVGDVLAENAEAYGELITTEMGKPISQAIREVEGCANMAHHYAEYAGRYLQSETHPSPAGIDAKTVHDPLGVILGVMPWNFPFWQVFRFSIPAIAAGNTTLLKHAPEVPGCSQAAEEVYEQAGAPDGLFQSILADVDAIHERLLPDPRIRGATLTGSNRAGAALAESAGANVTKTVLELGGSDPYLVLEDANVEAAAGNGVWARMMNTGQSCIAAKRMIVHEAVYEDFRETLVAGIEDLQVGDPMDEDTDIGPMVSVRHRDHLAEQVAESVEAGATVVHGGAVPDREGAYYEPTVLEEVPAGCPAVDEELFGPVATLVEVSDDEEAIAVANDTNYGLGASVWTEDRHRAESIARRIDTGQVFVNAVTSSDPRVPFGGVKDSGYGRELGEAGLKEWVNRKTVWID
jgi:succinate-semialdehyde dehydrogenase/glutarate-semialdehyde dehydrogenase